MLLYRTKYSVSSFVPIIDGSTLTYSLPIAKAPCPIFTYYHPLTNSIDSTLIQTLEVWGCAFYAHGFYPIVMNRTSAQTRANFTEISRRFSQFPTVNPAEYELSCYVRWIALAEQGGGLLMDYDILPMTSLLSDPIQELKKCKWGSLTTYASMTPMVTHGNTSEVERWLEYMINFNAADITKTNGKAHTSDMMMAVHAINHNQSLFSVRPALPFFHYSHHARHTMLDHIKRTPIEIMIRNQHIYHFLHHNIYLPISASISPYSLQIVRSLTLCPDIITTYDDLDSLCMSNNNFPDICKLITVDGFWLPKDPESGKCTWKNGRPDNVNQWGTYKSVVQEREPFVVAVLPQPTTYMWRVWSMENSVSSKNTSNMTLEFKLWALRQSSSSMLDALILEDTDHLNIDARITRTINAMRSGQALLITENFLTELQKSEGKEGIENWISAHVGFFLSIAEPRNNWESDSVIDLTLESFSGDDRFFHAVDVENKRWTKNWKSWRKNFLPVGAASFKAP